MANNPFYITPYMSTEEIDKQVQQIYLQIILIESSNLKMEDTEKEIKDSFWISF